MNLDPTCSQAYKGTYCNLRQGHEGVHVGVDRSFNGQPIRIEWKVDRCLSRFYPGERRDSEPLRCQGAYGHEGRHIHEDRQIRQNFAFTLTWGHE